MANSSKVFDQVDIEKIYSDVLTEIHKKRNSENAKFINGISQMYVSGIIETVANASKSPKLSILKRNLENLFKNIAPSNDSTFLSKIEFVIQDIDDGCDKLLDHFSKHPTEKNYFITRIQDLEATKDGNIKIPDNVPKSLKAGIDEITNASETDVIDDVRKKINELITELNVLLANKDIPGSIACVRELLKEYAALTDKSTDEENAVRMFNAELANLLRNSALNEKDVLKKSKFINEAITIMEALGPLTSSEKLRFSNCYYISANIEENNRNLENAIVLYVKAYEILNETVADDVQMQDVINTKRRNYEKKLDQMQTKVNDKQDLPDYITLFRQLKKITPTNSNNANNNQNNNANNFGRKQ